MRQEKLNKHGQPFSKKQKKASRSMMAMRKGFQPRQGQSGFNMPIKTEGLMAAVASLLMGMKLRRKAS